MIRLILLALTLLPLSCSSQVAEDCSDTIVIDSVAYAIPDRWNEMKLDSSEIADPTTLVRLPEELCFEDYRIYVTVETRDALVRMADAAKKDSVTLIVDSGFRSPDFQRRIIKRRLAEGENIEAILSMVAPPGYSQHHTGRAVDFAPSEAIFADTDAYRWLTEHAERFGFVETYPDDSLSNHPWEAWHRYFDPELAADSATVSE